MRHLTTFFSDEKWFSHHRAGVLKLHQIKKKCLSNPLFLSFKPSFLPHFVFKKIFQGKITNKRRSELLNTKIKKQSSQLPSLFSSIFGLCCLLMNSDRLSDGGSQMVPRLCLMLFSQFGYVNGGFVSLIVLLVLRFKKKKSGCVVV